MQNGADRCVRLDNVLDATIALKWSFEEVFSDHAKLLLPRLLDGTDQAFAPALLLAEVGHNLQTRRFQKNLPPEDELRRGLAGSEKKKLTGRG